MFTPWVRWVLVATCVVLAGFMFREQPATSLLPLVAVVLIVHGYFRNGTVWLSFRALRRGDAGRARELLGTIRRPDLLSRRNRAYHAWIRGGIALEEGDPATGAAHLRAALEEGFPTSNERSAVTCMLADACRGLGDRAEAAALLAEARALPHREILEPHLDAVAAKLAADPG